MKNIIKPEGHFNKPVIAGIVFIILFLLFVFLPGGGDNENELAQTKVKAEKLPSSSSDDLTGVSAGSVTENSGNANTGETSILDGNGIGNINANTTASTMGANTNTMSNSVTGNYNQPVTTTTTKTYTTIEPQNDGASQSPTTGAPQPSGPTRQSGQTQRRQMSEDFTVDFGENEQQTVSANNPSSRNSQVQVSDVPVRQLRVMPGTKIQMMLNEPFRSGIETKVQAICLNNIKGVDGKVIIPSNSVFELTFRPEEISGRVLARNVARVYLNDGSIGEIVGIIKGADGYAGLTGKITKQNDKGIGGKILGGIARVTAGRLGQLGGAGTEVQNEMENSGVTDREGIYRSSRVVEIAKGTQFYLFVGTPE